MVPYARASRHLAAIANSGGGYLVFGFNDDGTRCTPVKDVRKLYAHDVIAGVIDRYLQPKFQCELFFESCEGVEHAIVWIPSHGETPVISKANGPHDAKGEPQGIRSGTIYVRTPKPESVPATTPDHFTKLIQRCILARRDELVEMFSAIVSGGAVPAGQPDREREQLGAWHKAAQRAFLEQVGEASHAHRIPPAENLLQFSYLIKGRNLVAISPDDLPVIVERMNQAVRDTVRYGWSMFHAFSRPGISPYFTTDDTVDGGDIEFLQTSLVGDGNTNHLDFWRISPDGRASLIRNYHEDRFERPAEIANGGKWFDPWLQVRDLTELARHARAYAEQFADVREIYFQVEWTGLKSRMTATANPERYVEPHVSQTDRRVVSLSVPHAQVIGDLPAVVSRLYAPVHRLFDPQFRVTAQWISRLMPGFVVPGL
ncbi:MAG: AlbA family DNA-binding domain-containing protein [Woeseiaceae bacterium]